MSSVKAFHEIFKTYIILLRYRTAPGEAEQKQISPCSVEVMIVLRINITRKPQDSETSFNLICLYFLLDFQDHLVLLPNSIKAEAAEQLQPCPSIPSTSSGNSGILNIWCLLSFLWPCLWIICCLLLSVSRQIERRNNTTMSMKSSSITCQKQM